MTPLWITVQAILLLSGVPSNVLERQTVVPLRKDCIMFCYIQNGYWVIKNAGCGKADTSCYVFPVVKRTMVT